MASEQNGIKQNGDLSINNLLKFSNEDQTIELNNRLKTNFMSYCFSFLNEDEEARQCAEIVWNKYLQCVGDVAMVKQFSFIFSIYFFILVIRIF
jgi:preprotein translocase subunit SecE